MSVCFRGYLVKGQAKDADEKRIKIVKCLLEAGAQANYTTENTKMTAAHWAAYNKDFNVVRELLNHGADHFTFSHMERLPIDVGGSSRAWDVVDVFLNSYYEKVRLEAGSRIPVVSSSIEFTEHEHNQPYYTQMNLNVSQREISDQDV